MEEIPKSHQGIYRLDNLSYMKGDEINMKLIQILSKTQEQDSQKRRTYFQRPEDFLDTWISGYNTGKTEFGDNPHYDTKGFELWHIDTDMSGEELRAFLLCADGNELYDQKGYMNLGVNHLGDETVQIYRGKNNDEPIISSENLTSPEIKKYLSKRKSFYVWDDPEEFPFESPNPMKSAGNKWQMIGYTPLVVYQKLEQLGFVFD